MSAAEWFYAVKNQRRGPVTLEELQAKALQQEIKPTDLVWKPGFAGWIPAQQAPGIFLDKTLMGATAPEEEPIPANSLERTEVTSPTPMPVDKVLAETQATSPGKSDEEKLFLTALPEAAPASEGIDSLTGERLPPRAAHAPRRTTSATETSIGGFALRWNLREVAVSEPERSQCLSSGVGEPQLQQYLAWRRSLLQLLIIPAALCVIFGLVSVIQQEGLTAFGKLVGSLRLVPLLAMPVAVLWATTAWWRWKFSRQVLFGGWLVAFALPALLGLLPPDWLLLPANPNALLVVGLALFLHLLPALWMVLPGCLRAALRLKELMPENSFTGWMVAFAAGAHALLTLTVLLALNTLIGNAVLVLAGLCYTLAPLAYLWKAPVLLRPLTSEEEKTAVAQAQLANLVLTLAGFVLLLIYVFAAEIAGRRLVGMDGDTSWLRPWNGRLLLFPLELFTRSLLTTVVAADFLLLLGLKYWRQTKEFQGTPAAHTQEEFLRQVEQQINR